MFRVLPRRPLNMKNVSSSGRKKQVVPGEADIKKIFYPMLGLFDVVVRTNMWCISLESSFYGDSIHTSFSCRKLSSSWPNLAQKAKFSNLTRFEEFFFILLRSNSTRKFFASKIPRPLVNMGSEIFLMSVPPLFVALLLLQQKINKRGR